MKRNMKYDRVVISIIVPVYNVEPYLCHCVESILKQTYSGFELILVDDGSPDHCPEICDDYARTDSRVRVIHQDNAGLSVARNVGIDQANGEYLCFIDSDDILSSNYCEILLKAIQSTNCKIAACKVVRFVNEDNPQVKNNVIFDNADVSVMTEDDFLRQQMAGTIEMGVVNRLFHRTVFDKIRFMPGRLHEDIIFAGDLLREGGGTVAYLDTPLYYYRQRKNSIVNQQVNSIMCSPDRVFAGDYLLKCAVRSEYKYLEECLTYAVQYPWSFVDPIYVHFSFRKNRFFLNSLRKMIRDNRKAYLQISSLDVIQRKRMLLFSHSKILYGLNAYARLFRVYVYHVLKLDAYSDGHGI